MTDLALTAPTAPALPETALPAPALPAPALPAPALPDPALPDPAPVSTVRTIRSAEDAQLLRGYRAMVLGRRFDQQATNLAKQGLLAVYPSSWGQEACQVGAALALRSTDWMFPTYRDSVAVMSRGIDPGETLALLRGDRHCGYDTTATRTAPHCTPLATQAAHGVGLAMAARRAGDDAVALVLCGDGATSEGDFHEAVNLAAVFAAPVVFLVQNNGYAISVPLSRQTRAASLVAKADGYGITGVQVDGNDLPAVLAALSGAVETARRGGGPALVEALTYRMGAHTNADDPSRYRDADEAVAWRAKDPVDRLAADLRRRGVLDEDLERAVAAEAEELAARTRSAVRHYPAPTPADMFTHVYAVAPGHVAEQARAFAVAQDGAA